ncbi:MAG: hypothetical protein EOP49_08135 [Sphingobacteriales bacterium]|nr:MAG: hypothetical protein EOP49_08135 [Sphingobacteriales bacterium]
MSDKGFDLIQIVRLIRQNSKLVLTVTLIAGAIGLLFTLIGKKRYKARAEFFVSNPLFNDRSNIYRTDRPAFIEYFADENDIDKVIAFGNSRNVREEVIRKAGLIKELKIDTTEKGYYEELEDRFRDRYDIKRTEYTNLEITFLASDPQVAALAANTAVDVLENSFRGYFANMRNSVVAPLQQKIVQADSTINVLTDTLAKLRDEYRIYDIISPSRANLMTGSISGGGSNLGRGIELIQNLESIKDQMVIDRARNIASVNEFTTTNFNMVHVISRAVPPDEPAGLGLLLNTIACALAGLFLVLAYLLIRGYYSYLNRPAH